MSSTNRTAIWISALVVTLVLVWLLGDVLLPFLVGLAIGYFLDPVVQYLHRRGLGRGVAAILVIVVFFAVVTGAIVALAPVLERQFIGLVERAFALGQDFIDWARPIVDQQLEKAGAQKVSDVGGDLAGKATAWFAAIVGGLWKGGLAIVNILSLAVITPVVAFYMLRDWPKIKDAVDSWLPRDNADTIRDLLHKIDLRMAGFVRGQALVCLLLGIFYAVSLTLIGLNYGLTVGLLSGVLTFVPFIGATIGGVATVAIAVFQYDSWVWVAVAAGIFAVGQFLEGNILSPKLVGDRVGLHEVWLIFALMAGGALFGFVGVLLAVPVAAALGVLIQHWLGLYLESPLYKGSGGKQGER